MRAFMPAETPSFPDSLRLRERVLSRWDNEGGALHDGPQDGAIPHEPSRAEDPRLTNAELVQLRVRVIALENLVIALLAEGPNRQAEIAREMAAYISPRLGFTDHPLTIRAAGHMIDLVERSGCFRTGDVDEPSPAAKADRDG
jgi:hypothetical protein